MRIPEDALFDRHSVSARVLSESVLLLGGPRALLLQIAHPAVAAGVAEHSDFEAHPFARLQRTLDAMHRISFGSGREAREVLARLRRIHAGVAGTLPDGQPYRATDPHLLLWVHATLVDTVLEVERRYLARLTEAERHRFYDESRRLARAFDVPDELVPPDLPAFFAYVGEMVATLEVSDVAKTLARSILSPPLPLVPGLLWEPLRLVTVDLLPRRIREAYGLHWDANRKRLLRAAQATVRAFLPRIPAVVRTFPTSTRHLLLRAG